MFDNRVLTSMKGMFSSCNCVFFIWAIANFSCSKDNEPTGALGPEVEIKAVTHNEIEVEWTEINGAEVYEVDVALDSDFNVILSDYDQARVAQTQLLIQNLKASTTYFIQVRGILASGNSSENSIT